MRRSGNPVRRLLSQILAIGALISVLTLAPTRPSGAQEVAPSWSYTGSLKWGHFDSPAMLLPDGKVLVVGVPEVELYDPSTGKWSVNGTLKLIRQDDTATLLGNGKVLVEGGDEAELTNTAELYDPATGESRFTGNLNVPRVLHTATLLPNGKVLFAGGGILTAGAIGIGLSPTNTAELYDPATGQWSLTGNLSTARTWHAAALLQNGKVLVAGGCLKGYCQDYTASAEIYDPNTETWSSAGSFNTPRILHALTLLPNGNVLMSGGEGNVFPFTLNTAELYNPDTGLWSTTGSLLNRRKLATTTLLSTGQVLVVGGSGITTEVSNSAELYDPATGAWSATASLNTARYFHTATLLNNGKVLVVGGPGEYSTGSKLAELYDPTCPSMLAPTSRNFAASGDAGLVTVTATEGCAGTVATVSAASYRLTGLAGEAIASSFGAGLATATSPAATLTLPTEIAGISVKVKDSAGVERLASLFYVSPIQVNYQIPAGTAFALRVKADGSHHYEPVVRFDAAQNKFVARPLDLGPEGEQVYLILFGIGFRSRSSLAAVVAAIGGTYATVSFAGAHPDFAGLDQVNVLLPRNLMGHGEVDVLLTVEAQIANPVRLQIK
jgi:N-acetylneuraminic acid mutarotase